jgi:FixJ family two-component response regulator
MIANLNGTEVFVVDDDELILDLFTSMFEPEGCRVSCFAESQSFLAAARARVPACILLDVNLPGRSGLDVLRELDAVHYPAPIFIVSGQRDVPTAVNAIRNGALDFIEKPVEIVAVLTRVIEAIGTWARRTPGGEESFTYVKGAEQLTPREREVLAQIVAGASNKEAGRTLSISPRTVEVHRARIMDKLGARNTADLVRTVLGPRFRH